MQHEPFLTYVGVFIVAVAGSAAIGGCIAYAKRRRPLEGVLLGLFLGPIGVLIESQAPFIHRPMVDEKAWNSLRSMLSFQEKGRDFNQRKHPAENRSA
jgi:hypothetical protein